MSDWPFQGLTPGGYGLILADPPYTFVTRSQKGVGKSPQAHYSTMQEPDIAALPVRRLAAKDCLLMMWSTWPHLSQALRLMAHWGFTYKTGGSWTKTTATGKRAFGTGYILRSTTEPFIVGTVGTPKVRSRSERNLIESLRREHSRKPPEMRAMLDRMLPDVRGCELFAREPWLGRDVWGLEMNRFTEFQEAAE